MSMNIKWQLGLRSQQVQLK